MSSLNMSAITWDDIIDTVAVTDNDPEISYNFTEDPLLVSCTLYRMIKESTEDKSYKYLNWSLTEHMDKIMSHSTDQDRLFAEMVRSYYRSKLLVAKLRNENFTRYRTDLLQYLNESPLKVTSKFVGMIYKLPYFYEYDMKLTEIFDGEYASVDGSLYKKDNATLKFIAKANNGRKRSMVHEYWFTDSNNNRVLLEVAKTNPMLNLWDHTINIGKINIDAKFEKKHKDNLEYYLASGWTVNVTTN